MLIRISGLLPMSAVLKYLLFTSELTASVQCSHFSNSSGTLPPGLYLLSRSAEDLHGYICALHVSRSFSEDLHSLWTTMAWDVFSTLLASISSKEVFFLYNAVCLIVLYRIDEARWSKTTPKTGLITIPGMFQDQHGKMMQQEMSCKLVIFSVAVVIPTNDDGEQP